MNVDAYIAEIEKIAAATGFRIMNQSIVGTGRRLVAQNMANLDTAKTQMLGKYIPNLRATFGLGRKARNFRAMRRGTMKRVTQVEDGLNRRAEEARRLLYSGTDAEKQNAQRYLQAFQGQVRPTSPKLGLPTGPVIPTARQPRMGIAPGMDDTARTATGGAPKGGGTATNPKKRLLDTATGRAVAAVGGSSALIGGGLLTADALKRRKQRQMYR